MTRKNLYSYVIDGHLISQNVQKHKRRRTKKQKHAQKHKRRQLFIVSLQHY